MIAAEFVSRLGAKAKPSKTTEGWQCLCPAHDDNRASLSVTQTKDRILIRCHAGCTSEEVCTAAGLTVADLFTETPQGNGQGKQKRIVATYRYCDESGNLLFETVRYDPKDFKQRQPDPANPGGWLWNLRDVRRVLYRLPELKAAISAVQTIYIAAGEKDVNALIQRGFAATCNPLGEKKDGSSWLPEHSETLRGAASVVVVADKDVTGRSHARTVATALREVVPNVKLIELPDRSRGKVKDAHDFFTAGGTEAELNRLVDSEPVFTSNNEPQVPTRYAADELQRVIADPRPKIRLPGSDRLLSDFATELVQVLRDQEIYWRSDEIVTVADGQLKPMTPQTFRCWAEKFFVGYRVKTIGENSFQFDVTMADNEARGTLAAPQFIEALRRIRRVNRTRLPILGSDGKLMLLPNGYHVETHTLTHSDVEFDSDMPLNIAVATINELLSEFRFADGERSKAVAVAAMTGLFANQLLPQKSLRPCFIFVANAEGAGKTLLVQICITPTLGSKPIGSKPDDDDEMRKVILTAVREARSVIFLDNLKGRLSSDPLEAFISAPDWTGRKLGTNADLSGENLATVFCTGNGMTVSPDMRRRSLFVELHLEAECAEDRQFNRVLDSETLLGMRPRMLASLWSMVRHWDEQGRPRPSRGHSAFPSWANIIGGIVEAAGFVCPLATADVTAATDPDAEDMRRLVSAMADTAAPRTFKELIKLAREHGLFESILGTIDNATETLGRSEKSTFGRLLTRYDRRLVLKHRFLVGGKGKSRLYRLEVGNCGHGGHGGHGISEEKNSLYASEIEVKHHADHADHA